MIRLTQLVHHGLAADSGRHVLGPRRPVLDRLAEHKARARHGGDLGGDLPGDGEETLPIDLGNVRCGRERHGNGGLVRPAVALHADGAHGQHREGEGHVGGALDQRPHLRNLGRGEGLGLGAVGAQHTDGEAGPREGLTPHEVLGQPEALAERPHLVLVVVLEGLDDLALVTELANKCGVVVMCFDDVCLCRREVGPALDQVRAEGALREEDVGGVELERRHGRVCHGHESVSDDHPLVLRGNSLDQGPNLLALGRGGAGVCEVLRAVDHVEVDPHLAERHLDGVALVQPHEAVVHMHCVHALGSDGLAAQRGADGGVHPAGDEDEDVLGADGLADLVERGLVAALGRVLAGEASNLEQKVLEHGNSMLRKVNLRVELHPKQPLLGVLQRHNVPAAGPAGG
mmetsp:Transcript_8980/g.17428  ORF Transcript_8980/g.17428 Transcript_8980/m.17428 type:complete len:401 (-) Transcript_8980:534-1736(-)